MQGSRRWAAGYLVLSKVKSSASSSSSSQGELLCYTDTTGLRRAAPQLRFLCSSLQPSSATPIAHQLQITAIRVRGGLVLWKDTKKWSPIAGIDSLILPNETDDDDGDDNDDYSAHFQQTNLKESSGKYMNVSQNSCDI